MADRPKRAVRRQVSDVTEDLSESSEGESEDFDPRKADAARRGAKQENATSPSSARSKRTSGGSVVMRSTTNAANDGRQSIKLTMKVAPSKLREVMRANEVDSLHDTLGGGKVIDGPRSRRSAAQPKQRTSAASRLSGNRSKYQEYAESDIDNAEEEEDGEDDAEGEVVDATMDDFDEIGAEAEGGTEDEDEDEEMEDAPTPPIPVKKNQMPPKGPKITLKAASKSDKILTKPKLIVTPANVGPVRPVEDQEMEDDPGDSEAESSNISGGLASERKLPEEDVEDEGDDDDDDEDDDDEDDEDDEEDPEGEEGEGGMEGEGEGEGEDNDDEDDSSDSGDETPASGMQTPDPAKMTQRQRRQPGEELMALDMAPQQRKFFTDAEKAMKKDEHARKRKELTKRKTQEEKTAALNRLLKPQVSKTRGAAPKAETLAAQMQAVADEEEMVERADPQYTRWISTKHGIQLAVPEEWLGQRVGRYFGPSLQPSHKVLIQEVE